MKVGVSARGAEWSAMPLSVADTTLFHRVSLTQWRISGAPCKTTVGLPFWLSFPGQPGFLPPTVSFVYLHGAPFPQDTGVLEELKPKSLGLLESSASGGDSVLPCFRVATHNQPALSSGCSGSRRFSRLSPTDSGFPVFCIRCDQDVWGVARSNTSPLPGKPAV